MHTPFMDKSPTRRAGTGAGGRLKHRLAQLLVRSSCTTTTSATAFVSLDKPNADSHEEPPVHSPFFCTPCTYQRPKFDEANGRPRRARSASLVHISIDCTGGAAAHSGRRSIRSDTPLLPTTRRSKSKPLSDPSASRRHCLYEEAWGRARRPRRALALYSSSSLSTATDDELAPFSTDEEGGGEAETRTLLSSLSFSSDSTAEFYHTNVSSVARKNAPRRAPPRRALPRTGDPPEAFRPLVSAETKRQEANAGKKKGAEEETCGGVGAGMAVVKRSSNPYADFRSSMVEMIVERRIASAGKMEALLGSYLSLNSPQHHPAILAAFEDVWEAVFGEE